MSDAPITLTVDSAQLARAFAQILVEQLRAGAPLAPVLTIPSADPATPPSLVAVPGGKWEGARVERLEAQLDELREDNERLQGELTAVTNEAEQTRGIVAWVARTLSTPEYLDEPAVVQAIALLARWEKADGQEMLASVDEATFRARGEPVGPTETKGNGASWGAPPEEER